MKRRGGFTLVELIIVIVIIGVLAAITLIGFTRYQMDARNAERQAKLTVIAEALEKYYDGKGEYPGCTALTQQPTVVRDTVLPGIDPSALLAPNMPTSATTSLSCSDITASTTGDPFAYVGDGSLTCTSGPSCLEWKLKYKKEGSSDIGVIESRRKSSVTTSGDITLNSLTITGFTNASLAWTTVANATSYELQRATNSSFTANVQTTSHPGLSATINSLAYGTTYYFRVRPIAASSQGDWSNVRNGTTWSLAKPVLTGSAAATTFTGSWGAISHAASYVAQCSSNGTTWSAASCQGTTTGTSFTFPNASQGAVYYMRTQAVNGIYSSDWSNIVSVTTSINAPAAYSLGASETWNVLTGTSNAVCPAGTTPSYDWYRNGSTFWVSGTQYRAVGYSMSWNETITLSVATRCITGAASSGFVWASNTISKSLMWPTVWINLPGDSVMYWGGTCPAYATSHYYNFRTNGRVNASGNTTATSYSPGTWWGNGRAYVTLYCSGPWGVAAAETNSMYGPGCVPNPTVAECYQ